MKKGGVRLKLPGIKSTTEKIVVVSIILFCALIIALGTGRSKVSQATRYIADCLGPAQAFYQQTSTLSGITLDALCSFGKIRKRSGYRVSSCNDGKGFMVEVKDMNLKQCRILKKRFSAYGPEMAWFKKDGGTCRLCFVFQ